MLINFVTFDVDTDDRAAFDAWYIQLTEQARQEEGCVLYTYLRDPAHPTRGVTVAAWRTEADIAAHRLHPSHIELMALGSTRWGIRDLEVHSFRDVGTYKLSGRSKLDESGGEDESRARMLALIQAFQDANNVNRTGG